MNGYLSIFLALSLTVMISLCLTFIEGVRKNTLIMEIECVTDIGMNSILAEFHRELWNQYDLLFIDTSYGTAEASYEKTSNHLKDYMNKNFGSDRGLWGLIGKDFLALEAEEVIVQEISVASDENGIVLRKQVIDCMEEKIGVGYLNKIEGWIRTSKEYRLDEEKIEKQISELKQNLEEWEGEISLIPEQKELLEPMNSLVKIFESGILNYTVDVESLSEQRVVLDNYLSNRNLNVGTGINPHLSYNEDIIKTILFNEYILEYTGNYREEKNNSLLKYQVEYILGGQNSDICNLKYVANEIWILREIANVLHIIGCEEKMNFINTIASSLATVLTLPEIEPAVKIALVLAWAGLESVLDISLLFNGEKVPLMKSEEEWFFGSFSPEAIIEKSVGENTEQEGLSYSDYLRIFLALQDTKTTTFRLMDIMEMDIRQTQGNNFFRMDGCIDSLQAEIDITSAYGYRYSITRCYGY